MADMDPIKLCPDPHIRCKLVSRALALDGPAFGKMFHLTYFLAASIVSFSVCASVQFSCGCHFIVKITFFTAA